MRYILGIDPGSLKSGYILISVDTENILNEIIDKNHLNNEIMTKSIIRKYIEIPQIESAIETIVSYGNNIGQTTIDTAIWAGRFFQLIKSLNRKPTFIKRPDIKLNLCQMRNAKSKNVKQAIKDRFGEIGTKKNPGRLYDIKENIPKGSLDHIWSSLAIAISYYDINYGDLK